MATNKPRRDLKCYFSSPSTKAPAPNSIGFECIKKAYTHIPDHFNSLYKRLLDAGHHPTC
jgi:hypothetical protein